MLQAAVKAGQCSGKDWGTLQIRLGAVSGLLEQKSVVPYVQEQLKSKVPYQQLQQQMTVPEPIATETITKKKY